MPLSPDAAFDYGIDPASRLALACMRGRLTGPDMRFIAETVHNDPAWEPGFDAIWDCSRVEAHVVSPHEVEPILVALDDGDTGRDVLVEGPDLAADLFAKLLVVRARRRGAAAYTSHSLPEAVSILGRDALPVALQSVAHAAG